jgi:hypothetical protein
MTLQAILPKHATIKLLVTPLLQGDIRSKTPHETGDRPGFGSGVLIELKTQRIARLHMTDVLATRLGDESTVGESAHGRTVCRTSGTSGRCY